MYVNQTRNATKNEELRQADFFNVCSKCKISCCSGVRPPITLKRKAIIEHYLKKNEINVKNIFKRSAYTFPKETLDNYCVFFDKDTRRCKVHPVKPETCVAGPVTFDINVKTGKIEWFLKMEKMCPLAGVLYKNEETLHNYLKSAKRELLQLVRDLDAASLQAILKIEEPDTFKIGEESLEADILAKLKSST